MRASDVVMELFDEYQELTIREITQRGRVSKQMAHYVIKKLLTENKVERIGHPPKSFYRVIPSPAGIHVRHNLTQHDAVYLEENFIDVTESGGLLQGLPAFLHWCRQRSLPVDKMLDEYRIMRERYNQKTDAHGFIDGIDQLRNTQGIGRVWLDRLHFMDFSSMEKFGRTRFGTLVHHAKQSQNMFLMTELMDSITYSIWTFLERQQADAVGFVPPTIRREFQLMKCMQTCLNLSLPVLEIKKINGLVPVPQMSLATLKERTRNAENTFAVTDRRKFQRLVLIDDMVASGATLNQIAAKIHQKRIANSVTGLAIVGSFDGFGVISDI